VLVICLPLLTDFNSVVGFICALLILVQPKVLTVSGAAYFFKCLVPADPGCLGKSAVKRVSFLFILVLFFR